jgi:MFS family permease
MAPRNPDGTWERGVLATAEPLSALGTNIQRGLLTVVSVGILLAAGTALVSTWRFGRHGRIRIGAWAVVGLIIFLAGAAYGMSEDPSDSLALLSVFVTPLGWAGGLAAIAAIWAPIIEVAGKSARRLLAKSTAVIIAATAVAALAFLAWSGGSIAAWDTAFVVALISFLIGVGVLIAVVASTSDPVDQVIEEPLMGEADPVSVEHTGEAPNVDEEWGGSHHPFRPAVGIRRRVLAGVAGLAGFRFRRGPAGHHHARVGIRGCLLRCARRRPQVGGEQGDCLDHCSVGVGAVHQRPGVLLHLGGNRHRRQGTNQMGVAQSPGSPGRECGHRSDLR